MDAKKFSLAELKELTAAELVGDPSCIITGVESLEAATSVDASFLANPKYKESMLQSAAGVICVDTQTPLLEGRNFLVSPSPSRAFQLIVQAFVAGQQTGFSGIHPTAVIHPEARIGAGVSIGPYAVVDRGACIGQHTSVLPFVFVGAGASIGSFCTLHAHAVVREGCVLGDRVILQPGAVIGSCGFGYTTDASGQHTKIDQVGVVIIEDDVEVGANTTIDRARFKATRICRGTKIDNLVQIGHNVHIGPDNIIVSQTGVAGSAKTGKNVIMGGQAGVVGHLEIADNVMIATRGGVSKTIREPGKYAGGPVMPLADYNRQQVLLRHIESYVKRIEALEKRLGPA
jgi:UDP-3-O-[3-hydroxymyristoyl] glucosamine N-acyltransferase